MIIYELIANLFILGLSLILIIIGSLALLGLLKVIYDMIK